MSDPQKPASPDTEPTSDLPDLELHAADPAETEFSIDELPYDTGHSSFECSFNVMITCTA